MTPIHLISHTELSTVFDNKARLCVCLCLKEIVGTDTCRSRTTSVQYPWYQRVLLSKLSIFLDMVKSRRARGTREETRRRGVGRGQGLRAFWHGSLHSPKYSLRSRRLEVGVARKKKNESAPVLSCAHYFQAPVTQAIFGRVKRAAPKRASERQSPLPQIGELARRLACGGMLRSRPQSMVNRCTSLWLSVRFPHHSLFWSLPDLYYLLPPST